MCEDCLSDEEWEDLAREQERFRKLVSDSPTKVVADVETYRDIGQFIPAYAYPCAISVLDREIGFDPINRIRILAPSR